MYSVYIHQFPNNKSYIGITSCNPVYRWGKGNEYNDYFRNAVKKYGWENVNHIVWATDLTKEDACKLEIMLIAIFDTTNKDNGYNLSTGGELKALGYKKTAEQKLRQSNTIRSKPRSEKQIEQVKQLHLSRKGKSPWNKGLKTGPRNITEEQKKEIYNKVSKALTGRKMSEEAKRKNSKWHKGKTPWNKGVKMSEELREHYADYWKRKGQ